MDPCVWFAAAYVLVALGNQTYLIPVSTRHCTALSSVGGSSWDGRFVAPARVVVGQLPTLRATCDRASGLGIKLRRGNMFWRGSEDFWMRSVQPLSMTRHQLSNADSLPRGCAAPLQVLNGINLSVPCSWLLRACFSVLCYPTWQQQQRLNQLMLSCCCHKQAIHISLEHRDTTYDLPIRPWIAWAEFCKLCCMCQVPAAQHNL
jgi:hypothetical protein